MTAEDLPVPAVGAFPREGGGCLFRVWAPRARRVELVLHGTAARGLPMRAVDRGYFEIQAEEAGPGTEYGFRLDGGEALPDPASRLQARGVHGPSCVVDPAFSWTDGRFRAPKLADYVLYEVHVGTFSAEGTFDGVVPRIGELRDLGATALEIMPVAQFPGGRNWGYDGVFPFAVQDTYGGPDGLRRLVDACHAAGLAVVLDVVYNHLGPEGNRFGAFGPYFTGRYRTPWGEAVNFDGPGSDSVRGIFFQNALYWIRDFHVDALRLDAVHAIVDESAYPFLEELAATVRREARRLRRRVYLIAESDRNDPRLVTPAARGGLGMDAQWSDDFHHALHALLTGEQGGYYADFGDVADLAAAWRQGFAYAGRWSHFRGRRHGRPFRRVDPRRLVVCAQNHDQVGNRMKGERLSALVSFEQLKLAAGAVLLSPFLPLLFMGEEYGETAPFLYFTSHGEPELVEAVRKGRREEFASFRWEGEPPDPQAEETFLRSIPRRELAREGRHRVLLELHRELLRLRRDHGALRAARPEATEVREDEEARTLWVLAGDGKERALLAFNFAPEPRPVVLPPAGGRWARAADSTEHRWGGGGPAASETLDLEQGAALELRPFSFILFLPS